MRNVTFLQDLMSTIADQGRLLLPNYLFGNEDTTQGLQALIEALVSVRGEASAVAVARQLLTHYRNLQSDDLRIAFFRYIEQRFQPDEKAARKAAEAYIAEPRPATMQALQRAVESPLQDFFRRLNLAPGGTAEIVNMREDLLRLKSGRPELARVDEDMKHLLQSWFNRGFLVLKRIDWQTPAAVLDKIIRYEAVHAITGWDDLRRRLEPNDRRCFAFFHPSMGDEPLIFVEVALMSEDPADIGSVLNEPPKPKVDTNATTAVFYSISNCQRGLSGISFGNFLIKQVVADLLDEGRHLKRFVTLSPVPRFAEWLARERTTGTLGLGAAELKLLSTLDRTGWADDDVAVDAVTPLLSGLVARYFLEEKSHRGTVIDPVGFFHLGNGARLERINVLGNASKRGLSEAHGVMVNYLYEPREIEQNHEAFANDGTIAASRAVRALLKGLPAKKAIQRPPLVAALPPPKPEIAAGVASDIDASGGSEPPTKPKIPEATA